MAKLYIANCTKHVQMFMYAVPEEKGHRTQRIEMGGQILIYQDAALDTIKYIIGQHEQYGLISSNEVPRTKTFIGLCYSIDRPVDIDRVLTAAEQNDDVLVRRGQEIRRDTAAIFANRLTEDVGDLERARIDITEAPLDANNKSSVSEGSRLKERITIAQEGKDPNSGKADWRD
jgi:hypothetical protein